MTTHTFRLSANALEQAKTQAGLVPLGRIVRILLLKWLRGEITITQEDVANEQHSGD